MSETTVGCATGGFENFVIGQNLVVSSTRRFVHWLFWYFKRRRNLKCFLSPTFLGLENQIFDNLLDAFSR